MSGSPGIISGSDPDLLIAAKGASSGYWPLGLAIASGPDPRRHRRGRGIGPRLHVVASSRRRRRRPGGARPDHGVAPGRPARTQGETLLARLQTALEENPLVGDVRGVGLLICVELVEDRESKTPFHRSARMTEQVIERAMELGLILYPSTGNVDGWNGDYLLIGPPLTVLDDEVDLIVDRVTRAMALPG